MKSRIALSVVFLLFCVSPIFAQTDLTIKTKSSLKIPGMPDMSALPAGMSNPMAGLENRPSVTYIKGSRMRRDTTLKRPGNKGPIIQTTILQCEKQREIQFTNKKKKYYLDSTTVATEETTKNKKKAGYVTITGIFTDTGERAKLFGYDSRHLKETITFTPSKNACMKSSMTIEVEGWYADLPDFTCPMKRNPREFQMDSDCFDEIDYQFTSGITGVALREIKKIMTEGNTMILEEETTEILKTQLLDSLFEPPSNYKAANSLKEVEDDSQDDPADDSTAQRVETMPETASNSAPTFALPVAGIAPPPLTEKRAGMIRIGIAPPEVITPDSKNNPGAGDEIESAVRNLLVDSLKAENVEAILLDSASPEIEAVEKDCDYIFFTNLTQKRGGGMFGNMAVMGAASVVSVFVPGIGGLIAGTVASQVMGQTMGKNARAKDEFTLDYKVVGLDKTLLSQAITKGKAKKDGEDVVSGQILQASKAVLDQLKK